MSLSKQTKQEFEELIKIVDCCLDNEVFFTLENVEQDLNPIRDFIDKVETRAKQQGAKEERDNIIDTIIKLSSKYWIDKYVGVQSPLVVTATQFKRFLLHNLNKG